MPSGKGKIYRPPFGFISIAGRRLVVKIDGEQRWSGSADRRGANRLAEWLLKNSGNAWWYYSGLLDDTDKARVSFRTATAIRLIVDRAIDELKRQRETERVRTWVVVQGDCTISRD